MRPPYWGHWGILNANLTIYGREVRASELASLAGSTKALKEEKEEQGRAGHGEQLGRKEMLGWTHSQDSSLHLSSVSNDSLTTGSLSW